MKRVVVTGMGALTPIGTNVKAFWQGLVEGKSGAAPITKFDATNFATKFAAELKEFSTEGIIDPRELKRLDEFSQYAIVAAHEAVEDSGINFEKIDAERAGVIVGSGIGGIQSFETEHKKYLDRGPRRISPFFIPQMIIDIASGHISIRYGMKGPNYSVISACATATHAIGTAYKEIKVGDADIIVTGGAEAAISPMGLGGFNSMKAISTRNDAPEKASRPFEKNRDGFVMGEGAGMLVLEELEHAKRRGATIYAEITGIGATGDAHHLTSPAPGHEGAVRAMRIAIRSAGLNPDEIDYINAHGTSTGPNDRNETQAIHTVFGEHAHKMSISSTKSMTGHLLGAAGGIESIASIMAIREGIVPATINYEEPDPECDLNYTPNTPVERKIKTAISNTFGFGGHNAVIAISKFE